MPNRLSHTHHKCIWLAWVLIWGPSGHLMETDQHRRDGRIATIRNKTICFGNIAPRTQYLHGCSDRLPLCGNIKFRQRKRSTLQTCVEAFHAFLAITQFK
ncbi:hypothetical protein F4808DRAFT_440875 [Astrocystis sublimbata]|nr:hypothetical protein F4808DRAFT_440875 [Astrocystis sublimbata]